MIAAAGWQGLGWEFETLASFHPMTKKSPVSPEKKKLLTRLALAQKQADAGKRAAKLAKLALRNAKQKFKEAKRAAKKLRKVVKALKADLTALSAKKPDRKPAAKKAVAKRAVVAPAPASVPAVPVNPVVNGPTDVPAQ
ncbi:MAG TPA: hypothetical protein VG734_15370 [Lacunisphaera sp.]|nr:hypothetical protein [Lacunisphaera sp.]